MSSSRSENVTQAVRLCVVLLLFWKISKMFQVFKECFKGLTGVFKGGVSMVVFQGCFKGFSRLFKVR